MFSCNKQRGLAISSAVIEQLEEVAVKRSTELLTEKVPNVLNGDFTANPLGSFEQRNQAAKNTGLIAAGKLRLNMPLSSKERTQILDLVSELRRTRDE